jgi:hypothetical protein
MKILPGRSADLDSTGASGIDQRLAANDWLTVRVNEHQVLPCRWF